MRVTACLAVLVALIQGQTAQESVRVGIHFDNSKASSAAQDTAAALLHGLLNAGAGGRPHQGGRPSKGVILLQPQASDSCRYWCKTPENQFYCCGLPTTTTTTTTTLRPVRPGCCPKVRLHCPRIGRPVPCTHDHSCPNFNDKCCFDRCLEQHVCKPYEPCRGR